MKSNRVNMWLRVRPSQKFPDSVIQINEDTKSVSIHLPKDVRKGVVNNQVSDWSFKTDGILHNANQEQVYNQTAADLITDGLSGYNGTVMCYGQTGSGKTFTMTGATESFHNRGIVPRSLSHLYKTIQEDTGLAVTVRISYLEIYNEQIFDLLSATAGGEIMNLNPHSTEAPGSPLIVSEDDKGVYVKGLTCHLAQTEEEALNLLFEGETNRSTAAHSLNRRSSRSHCIFTIYLETRSRLLSNAKYTTAKINFVDLAGSERLQKTQSAGKIQVEASYINKSLSFLEQTTKAMCDKNRDHVPYRQSKLTHYLKDAIGGNCRTLLIANVWGELEQIEETISTLRFGSRMMRVASEPIENKLFDPSVLVRNLRKEIDALKRELAMHDTLERPGTRKNNRTQVGYDPPSDQQKYEYRQQIRKYVEGSLDELDIINVRQIQCVFEIFRDFCRNADNEAMERIKATFPEGKLPTVDGAGMHPGGKAGAAGKPGAKPTLEDDVESVGDMDGRGYGVGLAGKGALEENGAYLQGKRKERKRGTPSPSKTPSGPQQVGRGPGGGGTSAAEVDDGGDAASGEQREEDRSPPPTRVEAFEEFKREKGSEIYRILSENKEVLSTKKQEYSRLANRINTTKTEIDRSKITLDSLKSEREAQGQQYTSDGEIIITEAEFLEISRLRQLKTTYKSDYEELKTLKIQVHYCQKMVDLTRQRLVEEFDRWYSESFVDPDKIQTSSELGFGQQPGTLPPARSRPAAGGMGTITMGTALSGYEDPLERFDRVKHDQLAGIQDAEPYNRAKEAVIHKHIFEAARNQSQPIERKPGAPVNVR